MKTRLLTCTLRADADPVRLSSLVGAEEACHVLVASSTLPLPVELSSDRSTTSTARRLITPGAEGAHELARLPLLPRHLWVRLAPRHVPEDVDADQAAPTTATDGIAVHDLDHLRVTVTKAPCTLTLWGWDGGRWARLSGPTAVGAEGISVEVPTQGLRRVAAQLTGIPSPLPSSADAPSLRWSVSAHPTDEAEVVFQVWEACP